MRCSNWIEKAIRSNLRLLLIFSLHRIHSSQTSQVARPQLLEHYSNWTQPIATRPTHGLTLQITPESVPRFSPSFRSRCNHPTSATQYNHLLNSLLLNLLPPLDLELPDLSRSRVETINWVHCSVKDGKETMKN